MCYLAEKLSIPLLKDHLISKQDKLAEEQEKSARLQAQLKQALKENEVLREQMSEGLDRLAQIDIRYQFEKKFAQSGMTTRYKMLKQLGDLLGFT